MRKPAREFAMRNDRARLRGQPRQRRARASELAAPELPTVSFRQEVKAEMAQARKNETIAAPVSEPDRWREGIALREILDAPRALRPWRGWNPKRAR